MYPEGTGEIQENSALPFPLSSLFYCLSQSVGKLRCGGGDLQGEKGGPRSSEIKEKTLISSTVQRRVPARSSCEEFRQSARQGRGTKACQVLKVQHNF